MMGIDKVFCKRVLGCGISFILFEKRWLRGGCLISSDLDSPYIPQKRVLEISVPCTYRYNNLTSGSLLR